jgi:predicted O-methyltransferase YrrM
VRTAGTGPGFRLFATRPVVWCTALVDSSLDLVAALQPETPALRAARERGDAVGVPAVPPETGALLRLLARLSQARTVVEIGSGSGYSGLWLLGGMDPRGTLTTIELDGDRHALAQQAFADAGAADRVRAVRGAALEVLPRLRDANYDLVFLDAVKSEYPDYLAHARRLLRPGGLLVADNALWGGRLADPSATDADTRGLRAFGRAVASDPALDAVVLPIGDGVLVATLS